MTTKLWVILGLALATIAVAVPVGLMRGGDVEPGPAPDAGSLSVQAEPMLRAANARVSAFASDAAGVWACRDLLVSTPAGYDGDDRLGQTAAEYARSLMADRVAAWDQFDIIGQGKTCQEQFPRTPAAHCFTHEQHETEGVRHRVGVVTYVLDRRSVEMLMTTCARDGGEYAEGEGWATHLQTEAMTTWE